MKTAVFSNGFNRFPFQQHRVNNFKLNYSKYDTFTAMKNPELDKNFWNERWVADETQWDVGYATPAIVEFIDRLEDKTIRILIPGCGNAYEAEYLHNQGFSHVFVVDYAEEALRRFAERVPSFPKDHLLASDFFELKETGFDLILEQTFFCAIDPSLRKKYVQKMHELLNENGALCGLLFLTTPNTEGPPFGGSRDEYVALFSRHFDIRSLDICTNSIKPREGRELWFEFYRM
ncbi:MAG TPA: methyltransferase domain-containing protein [Bacteroidia bacterium]|nr:methyltransferase domain-containing protein [Bacteroidia bacterium]